MIEQLRSRVIASLSSDGWIPLDQFHILQEAAPIRIGPDSEIVLIVGIGLGITSLVLGFFIGKSRGSSADSARENGPDVSPTTDATISEPDRSSDHETEERAHRSAAAALDNPEENSRTSASAERGPSSGEETQTGVPEQDRQEPRGIPAVPDISIDYTALTDREPVGAGGNADVVKATTQSESGPVAVALKTPRMDETLSTDDIDRLLAEAETWDKLDDHDHIVDVVGYESDPLPWIAMEYMDGGDLAQRSGQMDLPQALWTALGTTEAVRHAHRRGVAHLDLKPANVLFRSVDGAWDVPKVADWGLSKHLLDHSTSVEGLSPQYAAPEQFVDDGSVDDITDVYQLGAVLYELFTGRPPYEGAPANVMQSILDEEPTPPTRVDSSLPGEIDDVIATAMSKDRDDRFQSVVYVRDELRALYEGRREGQ